MIKDIPPIPGVVPQLITSVNERLRQIRLLTSSSSPAPGGSGSKTPVPTGTPAPPAVLTITFSPSSGQLGVPYSGSVSAAGGTAPYTYSITVGGLPFGLTLDPASGQISGTPLETGHFVFTANAKDADGNQVNDSFTITITPASAQLGTITTVTAALAGGARYLLPDQSTHDIITITPHFSGGVGTQNVGVWLFFRRSTGTAAAWYFQGNYPCQIGGSINLDELIVDGSAVTAQIAVQAGVFQGDSVTALAGPPAAAVKSGTFTLKLDPPIAGGATATITNAAGSAPTQANIYMGLNSLGNPYAEVIISVNTPGGIDPNCWYYQAWVEWVDSGGSPINPGGVNNTSGWNPGVRFVNDGKIQQWTLLINYPAAGVDGYLRIELFGLNRSATASVAPYTGDTNVTLQTAWTGSANHFDLHVGGTPGSVTTNPTSPKSNIGLSVAFDASFTFLNQIFGGRFIPTSYVSPAPALAWGFAGNTGANIFAQNADGPSTTNSLKLISDHSSVPTVFQRIPVTPNTPFNVSNSIKSSAGATTFVCSFQWQDSSFANIGSATSITLTGPFASWGNAYLGTWPSPSNAAYMSVQFALPASNPNAEWWEVGDVLVQAVVAQQSNSQLTTTAPEIVNGGGIPSGYSAAVAESTTTTAQSAAGLNSYHIDAADGSYAEMFSSASSNTGYGCKRTDSGDETFVAPGLIQIVDGTFGNIADLTANGFSSMSTGTPYSGSLAPSSYQGGVAIGPGITPGGGGGPALTVQTLANPWLGTPTSSRALSTVYRNTTGKTVIVCVTVQWGGTAAMTMRVKVDSVSTPTTIVLEAINPSTTLAMTIPVLFPVLPNYYYEIDFTGGGLSSSSFLIWTEWN